MPLRNPAPCLIVVFDIGAALERLEILPVLAGLFAQRRLHDETQILGLSAGSMEDVFQLRAAATRKLRKSDDGLHKGVEHLVERLHLERLHGHDETGYRILADNLKGFERAYSLPGDRLLDLLPLSSRGSSVLHMALRAGIDRGRGRLRAVIECPSSVPRRARSFFRCEKARLSVIEPRLDETSIRARLFEDITRFVESRC